MNWSILNTALRTELNRYVTGLVQVLIDKDVWLPVLTSVKVSIQFQTDNHTRSYEF